MRRLLTIPISHFCEKARWALERAGLPYREERHVQGVNRIVSRRAGGHGTLPVLICGAGVLAESEAILRYADAHLPEARRLFPDGAADVTALCRELDAGLGPEGRREQIDAHLFGAGPPQAGTHGDLRPLRLAEVVKAARRNFRR